MKFNEDTGSFEGIFLPYNVNFVLIHHAEKYGLCSTH